MRTLCLLSIVLVGTCAHAGQLCIDAVENCCGYPCDNFMPMRWIGFDTDAAPCEGIGYTEHGVSISSSIEDPLVNTGSIPGDGLLYLWLLEPNSPNYVGGVFSICFTGDLSISAYVPIASGFNYWYEPGCVTLENCVDPAPYVIGALLIDGVVGIEDESWGGLKALYR